MNPHPKNLYWDSCVFIRYLTEAPNDYVGDIEQYINDAKAGNLKIHFSTIAFTEIRPRFLRRKGYGSINQFFSDLGRAFCPFDPNPNIMIAAGALRDHSPTNPSDPKANETNLRSIGTPDAIHLMTCLYLRDVAGVDDIVFHTFDAGKGTSWEGKCVPLLDFERWFPIPTRVGPVAEVCDLKRCIPKHPRPDLITSAKAEAPIISVQRH